MSRLERAVRLGILGVLLAPSGLLAQVGSSALTGVARDASGKPLAGVQVTARSLETGLVRSTTSDGAGRYVLPGMPVGAYEVRAEAPDFRPLVTRGVSLVLSTPAVVDLTLQVGAPGEEVTVTSEAPLVQTRSGELSFLVSEEAIRDLPLNGRNYTDLAFLQPGVIAYPHRDGGSVVAHGLGASINGQDPRSNVYLLDGTPQNDFTNGPAGSAAGTALGTETVREFRVESNSYGAEFGRNFGGQVNVITKSGGNDLHGSVYEYHRNDALDARNFFDPEQKPEFRRNQFGATLGGPIRKDRTFFFVGYEGLRERLGRTISSFVPDENARRGLLPDPAQPGALRSVGVDPAVAPYLEAFPLPNGRSIGGGLAAYTFGFDQVLHEDFFQARLDQHVGAQDQLFVRYTFDRADQDLPTDFPQFPRTFRSKNQFATAEYRHVASPATLHTLRLGFSRTSIGQQVASNEEPRLEPFVPGRPSVGDIDIGGIPRFGPQSSADVSLRQKVLGAEYGVVHNRGRHLLKAGGLVERYVDDMYNPTFSLGIYTFANLESFLRNRATRFQGLTPEADPGRNWRFTLLGAYVQDELRATRRLSVTAGLRYEFSTLPEDTGGRDVALVHPTDRTVTPGPLYRNPTGLAFSPRVSFAWDVFGDGRTALRGGYGLYWNTNNQQNLIVTVTNPPATPRVIVPNPTFPTPPFSQVSNSIRPIQYDLQNPRLHMWNLGVQRELGWGTVVNLSYAGARGLHLLRNTDSNVPTPERLPDGTVFYPPTAARPNTAFSTIELKKSDGDSWYNALIVELRKRATKGLAFQSSYTFARTVDTTQASTFFSDATNGTNSAFPEPFGIDYNEGPADWNAKHNWVFNVTWDLPFARESAGLSHALFSDWQLSAIGRVRSGNPLSVFVASNRSRSRWSPSSGPGLGLDRPSLAPGRTPEDAVVGEPDRWFDPTAFVLQPAGTLGNAGRGAFIGPDLKALDLSLVKRIPWARLGSSGRLELRVEAFNVLNRANFGNPSLQAFAGLADNEQPLPSFGRIRTTVTSSRQVQLGVRAVF